MNRQLTNAVAPGVVVVLWLAGCVAEPRCMTDQECNRYGVCVQGACGHAESACARDSDCDAPETCRQGVCLAPSRCRTEGDCVGAVACFAGVCLPTRCLPGACPRGAYCDPMTSACELSRCEGDAGCGGDLACDLVSGRCRPRDQIPVAERCNGRDDDGDGRVDETFRLGRACTMGQGTCARTGVTVCNGDGQDWTCNAIPGTPSTEVCDGMDNDCDGETDEDFHLGEPCVAGAGACAPGRRRCATDHTGTSCERLATSVPIPEVCDGVDNDCDGETDEETPSVTRPCVAGLGVCRTSGVARCSRGGVECVLEVTPPMPRDEVCNGLDDDCDGETDDGLAGCEPARP